MLIEANHIDHGMDATAIRDLVEWQLGASGSFENRHGITNSNLRSHLIEPFEVVVDPDELQTAPRRMWVVLQERDTPYSGYVVVYDPATQDWGVAELSLDETTPNTLVVSASTLAGALDGM